MSGELLRMPATHLINGIETLERGLGEAAFGVWQRLRFDEHYRESVCALLKEQDAREVGESFTYYLNRDLSRLEILKELIGDRKHFVALNDEIVTGLQPLPQAKDKKAEEDFPLEPAVSGKEGIILRMYRGVELSEVASEMKRRRLFPLNTEEALSAAKYLPSESWNSGLAILDARISRFYPPHEEPRWYCLTFGKVLIGNHGMSLHDLGQRFSASIGFLAKRIR